MLTSGRQASDDIRKIKDKLKESVNEKITKLHKVISMYELRWFEKALDQLFEVRHARIVSVHTIPTYLCLLILHVNPHLNPLIAYAFLSFSLQLAVPTSQRFHSAGAHSDRSAAALWPTPMCSRTTCSATR